MAEFKPSMTAIRPTILAALVVATTACASISDKSAAEPTVLTCSERLALPSQEIALSVTAEQERSVPITLFVPDRPGAYPLIAFSHGAFASPTRYRAMLAPLAAAGYVIIAPMHIDSEEFGSTARPSPLDTWNTRNLDMALSLDPGEAITEVLSERGLSIDREKVVALGHSYGAIMAQISGGAVATGSDGQIADFRNPDVDVVVGWSPPGEVPGMISADGWSTLSLPTLTITGTADILPGFIDDWRAHKASYDYAPIGNRALWVGEGIDHYFGGMFGREKPADANSQRLFQRALEVSLNFIDRGIGRSEVCTLDDTPDGEVYQED